MHAWGWGQKPAAETLEGFQKEYTIPGCGNSHIYDAGVVCLGDLGNDGIAVPSPRIQDCQGVCVEQTMLGDGWCDAGDRIAKFNCQALGCDRGDCDRESTCTAQPPSCGAGQFQCGDSKCVPGAARCNEKVECADESDEQGCLDGNLWFYCPSEPYDPIPRVRLNDGDRDCTDGSDESTVVRHYDNFVYNMNQLACRASLPICDVFMSENDISCAVTILDVDTDGDQIKDGCDPSLWGQGSGPTSDPSQNCNPGCGTRRCGYDGGDCPYGINLVQTSNSAQSCPAIAWETQPDKYKKPQLQFFYDGVCEAAYNTRGCNYDAGECLKCTANMTANNVTGDRPNCYPHKNSHWWASVGLQRGDIRPPFAPGGIISDGRCDADCASIECGYDGGDCPVPSDGSATVALTLNAAIEGLDPYAIRQTIASDIAEQLGISQNRVEVLQMQGGSLAVQARIKNVEGETSAAEAVGVLSQKVANGTLTSSIGDVMDMTTLDSGENACPHFENISLGNRVCDSEFNTPECGCDSGDCGASLRFMCPVTRSHDGPGEGGGHLSYIASRGADGHPHHWHGHDGSSLDPITPVLLSVARICDGVPDCVDCPLPSCSALELHVTPGKDAAEISWRLDDGNTTGTQEHSCACAATWTHTDCPEQTFSGCPAAACDGDKLPWCKTAPGCPYEHGYCSSDPATTNVNTTFAWEEAGDKTWCTDITDAPSPQVTCVDDEDLWGVASTAAAPGNGADRQPYISRANPLDRFVAERITTSGVFEPYTNESCELAEYDGVCSAGIVSRPQNQHRCTIGSDF